MADIFRRVRRRIALWRLQREFAAWQARKQFVVSDPGCAPPRVQPSLPPEVVAWASTPLVADHVVGGLCASATAGALMADEAAEQPLSQIVVTLRPDGRVSMRSTCMGERDSSYAPMPAERLPEKLVALLAELREREAEFSRAPTGTAR